MFAVLPYKSIRAQDSSSTLHSRKINPQNSLLPSMAISFQIRFHFLAFSILSVSGAMLNEALDPLFTPFTASTTTTPPPSPQMTFPFITTPPPPPSPQMMPPVITTSSPLPQPPTESFSNDNVFYSQASLLAPILSHLGFNELATAAPSLSSDPSVTAGWSGPFTVFAPSDSSFRACPSCSIPSLLREHVVPGLFPVDYLRKLTFGTKIETVSPGRCITITSTFDGHDNNTAPKVFIGGMEITHPDLFNNGIVIIHGIKGYIAPLSPYSCDVERMTSLSFPFGHDRNSQIQPQQPQDLIQQTALMRLMLRDAMLRLRNNGFSVISLALKVKYPELVTLNNMTIFALDDVAIFSGSHNYIHNVRFHIVPNRMLTISELERLPVGTILPSLERGQALVVTTPGGGIKALPLRINYVRIRTPDVLKNAKIVVHSIFLPFPHIHPVAAAYDGFMSGLGSEEVHPGGMQGACSALDENGECRNMTPAVSTEEDKPLVTDEIIHPHHGL